jgi:hypothetical protein
VAHMMEKRNVHKVLLGITESGQSEVQDID